LWIFRFPAPVVADVEAHAADARAVPDIDDAVSMVVGADVNDLAAT
jgi:hypothetical protein